MAKGFWLARINIKDQAAYDEYRKHNAAPLAKFGGRFIVRGGNAEEGIGPRRQHNVVIEFDSYEQALACFRSQEYQEVSQFLKKGCEVDLVICAGYEGAQPQ